ncbi:MAG: alcohol dehydrogenase catalytic domain-containing protein [Acidobacteriota bacterium]
MHNARAYSAASATAPLVAGTIQRREPTGRDVEIEILYCGVCHSDLHQVRNEWTDFMPTQYPCVPGHEIVGLATATQVHSSARSTNGKVLRLHTGAKCNAASRRRQVYSSLSTASVTFSLPALVFFPSPAVLRFG